MAMPEKVLKDLKERPFYIEITVFGLTLFLLNVTIKPTFSMTLGIIECYLVVYSNNVDTDFLDNILEEDDYIREYYNVLYDDDDIDEERCEACEDKDECIYYQRYLREKGNK